MPPIYDFECDFCHTMVYDKLCKFDDPVPDCEYCLARMRGVPMTRKLSAPAGVCKGGGVYSNKMMLSGGKK